MTGFQSLRRHAEQHRQGALTDDVRFLTTSSSERGTNTPGAVLLLLLLLLLLRGNHGPADFNAYNSTSVPARPKVTHMEH